MSILSKQKQARKDYATQLIRSTVMLAEEKKEKWLKRLDDLGERKVEALIQGLQRGPEFLKGAIRGCVGTDKEALGGLKQVFRKSKRKVRVFEEAQHVEVDEEYLSSLEEQIKNL